jgi:ATP/maltotriose-dependent transcriptional regulator MalT
VGVISIVNDTLSSESLWGVRQDLKAACQTIREEFDQHLEDINLNTREISSAYDLLSELDFKLDKLAERLDHLEMHIGARAPKARTALSHREQEVFAVLYAADESLGAKEIGRRLGLPEDAVKTHLSNLIAKGIPILQRLDGSSFYLEANFKLLQARENVLRIDANLVGGLVAERML